MTCCLVLSWLHHTLTLPVPLLSPRIGFLLISMWACDWPMESLRSHSVVDAGMFRMSIWKYSGSANAWASFSTWVIGFDPAKSIYLHFLWDFIGVFLTSNSLLTIGKGSIWSNILPHCYHRFSCLGVNIFFGVLFSVQVSFQLAVLANWEILYDLPGYLSLYLSWLSTLLNKSL